MSKTLELNPVFEGMQPSSTLYINETVNQLWQQGERVFHMGFGESRFDVHPRLQQSLADNADKKSYLPGRGLPELIDVVAQYYTAKSGIEFLPSQVLIGPGSKALIYALQMVMNADVFLPTPSWVSYAPQATLLGNRVVYVPSKVEDNYRLDIGELDRLVKASDNPCKLLVINSPNNPTGEVWSADFLEQLANYCRDNDIWVLSDEIYFEVCHGDIEHVSIAKYYPQGTLVLGGLSKHLSIGGWRVGVALLPENEFGQQLMCKMTIFASETWSSVSAPIQYSAIDAYSLHEDVEQYVIDCRNIHGIRTRFIRDGLTAMGIQCTSGNGAFYIAANFDRYCDALLGIGVTTSTDLAAHLLNHYRIASLPGSDFGIPSSVLSLRLSTSYLDMESVNDPQRIFSLYKSEIGTKRLMSANNHPNTHAALNAFNEFLLSLSESR